MSGLKARFLRQSAAQQKVKSWTKPVSAADARLDAQAKQMRHHMLVHGDLSRVARVGLPGENNRALMGREVGKRDKPKRVPLPRTLSTEESGLLVARHGLTGTLPSHLSRTERMRVYEARYNASGGRKGEGYAHRAQVSDRVKTGGLAGATAAGAGLLAARTRAGTKLLRRVHDVERVRGKAETAGIASATVGGAAELYGDRARRKQASYTSTPAGVAASALRRLHAYPGGPQ